MTNHTRQLPEAMRRYLRRYILRRRRAALARRLGVAIAFALLWLLAGCFVDRLFPLRESFRLALLTIGAAAVLLLICGPVALMLSRRFDWLSAAAQIERHDRRFAGRLETAVSQLQQSPQLRGADELVQKIVGEVMDLINRPVKSVSPSSGTIKRPWLIVLAAAILFGLLSHSDRLGFGALVKRQLFPLSPVPPIRTTQIAVETGDASVPQGGSQTIVARATHLDAGSLTIELRSQDNEVVSTPMIHGAGDSFSFVLKAVDRDWHYRVTGGDAGSREYQIRVQRRPGVAQLRVKYVYPAYMNLSAASIADSDGSLEAPVGTEAWIDIVCTEPISSAACIVDGQPFVAQPTDRPEVRRAGFIIRKSGSYRVTATSTRGVSGLDSRLFPIQVQRDQPPRLQWLAPSEQQLDPMSTTVLGYQLTDDYGVASAAVMVHVNERLIRTIPLAAPDSRKNWLGSLQMSTNDWKVAPGDIVQLELSAADGAGQTASSKPLKILVTPVSVSSDSVDCADGFRRAEGAADALIEALPEAFREAEDIVRPKGPQEARKEAGLTGAIELADQLTRRLFQAVPFANRYELMDACHDLIDRSVACRSRLQSMLSDQVPPALDSRLDAISEVRQQSATLRRMLAVIQQGEQLRLIKVELENCRQLSENVNARPEQQRQALRDFLESIGNRLDARLNKLAIDPDTDDLLGSIDDRIEAEDRLLASTHIPDYLAIVRAMPDTESTARLMAGSLVEALQPAANYGRARDLHLAARAVASGAYSQRRIILNSFAAMQRDYLARRATSSALWAEQLNKIRVQSEVARQVLHRLVVNSPDGVDAELIALDEIASRTQPRITPPASRADDVVKREEKLMEELAALPARKSSAQRITASNTDMFTPPSQAVAGALVDFQNIPALCHTLASTCVRRLQHSLSQLAISQSPFAAAKSFTQAANAKIATPPFDVGDVLQIQRYAIQAVDLASDRSFRQALTAEVRTLPAVARLLNDAAPASGAADRALPSTNAPTVFDEPSRIYFELLRENH